MRAPRDHDRSQYFCYISYQQGEWRPLEEVFMLHLIVREWERELLQERDEGSHYTLHNLQTPTYPKYLLEILHLRPPARREPCSWWTLACCCSRNACCPRHRPVDCGAGPDSPCASLVWNDDCYTFCLFDVKTVNCIENCHKVNWVIRTFQRETKSSKWTIL